MKRFSIFLLCALALWSCAEEQDQTITDIELNEPPPPPGELIFLSGVVQDSLGNAIPSAVVHAVFDDFEYTDTADAQGAYAIGIPESKTEGYVMAVKDEFSRSILEASTEQEAVLQHILVPEEASSAAYWLSQFSVNNLFRLEGRCVSPEGEPVPGLLVRAWSYGPDLPAGFLEQGYVRSGADGRFLIIGEKGEYTSSSVFTFVGSTPCVTFYGEGFDANEDLIVVEITVEVDIEETLFPLSVNELGCGGSTTIYWTFFPEVSFSAVTVSGTYGPPSSIKHCSNRTSDLFFIGGSTERSAKYFDGGFYRLSDIPDPLQFDLCQPENYFLRIVIDGSSFEGEDANYGQFQLSPTDLAGETGGMIYEFEFDPLNSGQSSFGWWWSYGVIESAAITVGGRAYTLASSAQKSYYFFNFDVSGESTDATGILQGELQDESGTRYPFKAWFRADRN